jgi:hypothetical protein
VRLPPRGRGVAVGGAAVGGSVGGPRRAAPGLGDGAGGRVGQATAAGDEGEQGEGGQEAGEEDAAGGQEAHGRHYSVVEHDRIVVAEPS